eukprot:UN33422
MFSNRSSTCNKLPPPQEPMSTKKKSINNLNLSETNPLISLKKNEAQDSILNLLDDDLMSGKKALPKSHSTKIQKIQNNESARFCSTFFQSGGTGGGTPTGRAARQKSAATPINPRDNSFMHLELEIQRTIKTLIKVKNTIKKTEPKSTKSLKECIKRLKSAKKRIVNVTVETASEEVDKLRNALVNFGGRRS